MKKIFAFFLCFVTIIALFSINNTGKEFSFESYLTELSQVADERPKIPDTVDIENTLEEFELTEQEDTAKILKVVRHIWTGIKLLAHGIVFICKFMLFLLLYIVFLIKLVSVGTFNLFIW